VGKYRNVRKLLGGLVAGLALAGGVLGTREVEVSRARSVRLDADRAAEATGQRAAEGLSAFVSDLKLKAGNAAANPRLVFALQGNVDERTMRDLWRTEEWWRPWRTEFKVYAVAFSGLRLDIVEGIDAADLVAEELLRHVRDRGETSSEIILGKGWPYAGAATAVKVPGRDHPPILVLAKPLDQSSLRKLSDKTGGAITLTDGHVSLLDAGPEAERILLSQAIGSENSSPLFHAGDGTWAAAASPVAPGLWLWTFASAGAATHDAEANATERKLMLWLMASLFAGAALVFGLRRPRRTTAIQGMPQFPTGSQLNIPGATPVTLRGQGSSARATGYRAVDAGGATAVAAPGPNDMQFGRYTLLDRLGEGGMAEVYTAVTFGAEGFRRKFVIKRLRAELAREPAAVAQFIDEANLASSMVHSNIVPVFDFGKVSDEYFMALEYILGRDMARVTRRSVERDGRPLPINVVLYAVHETLKALEYAHAKTSETGQALGIVHRDVSPANVIVSSRGEVKLFDFGIVKAEGRVTKTQSGVVKGNVTFMSPEQARGANVDARADLFSLGLVLYYCLTGQVFYAGNTTYELLVKAATGPGPDEFNLIRALPDPCSRLLHRALQTNPAERFQSAREFSDAVGPHIGGGAAALVALMNHLFLDDFKNEETRFRTFGPSGSSGPTSGPIPGPGSGGPMPGRT
jgi:serine/threonine protein kinase